MPKPQTKSANYELAVLSMALPAMTDGGAGASTVPTTVHLLPDGEFTPADGRILVCGRWVLTAVIAAAVIALANAQINDFVIDYEHQTQLSADNGQPAPAAGWFKPLEFRPGAGLFATEVRWTERARQYIAAGEYRYLSAVFLFDKTTGVVQEIKGAALVNTPGLDGLTPLQLATLKARLIPTETPTTTPEDTMNPVLKAMLAALGLAETTTEEQATTALATLKAQATAATALGSELATLKAQPVDPAKYVPVTAFTALNTELATLKAKDADREVDALLATARTQGKVIPAVEDTYRAIGKSDLATLKALLDKTPANPALAGASQTNGQPPAADHNAALSPDELAVCKAMGLTPEQFVKAKVTTA